MTDSLLPRYDAIVVGARCAGAATALLLARAGARVLMLDRDAEGSDTLSTHALMRGAVVQLARWGMLARIVAAGTPPVRRTTFAYGPERTELEIGAAHGVDASHGSPGWPATHLASCSSQTNPPAHCSWPHFGTKSGEQVAPSANAGAQTPSIVQYSPAAQQVSAHESPTSGRTGSSQIQSTHSSPAAQMSPQVRPGPH